MLVMCSQTWGGQICEVQVDRIPILILQRNSRDFITRNYLSS